LAFLGSPAKASRAPYKPANTARDLLHPVPRRYISALTSAIHSSATCREQRWSISP